MKAETRHYQFETMAAQSIEADFIAKVCALSVGVQRFDTGLEGFVLSITAIFDDSCETEGATPSDVIHNFRKDITKVKEYSRKPAPQKYWTGEWITLK